MSTSLMSFGSTPSKLNQSTEANAYLPSHLFPSSASQALRDQEETYLTRNPQRITVTSNPPSAQKDQTPKQSDSDFKYFLNTTPYKTPTGPSIEKSPSSELPPVRSIYDVIHQPTTAYADTSMGDADTSFGASGEVPARVASDPYAIDWELDARGRAPIGTSGTHRASVSQGPFASAGTQAPYAGTQGTYAQGPFAGVGGIGNSTRANYASPNVNSRPQFGGPQSPPFAKNVPVEEDKPQAANAWVTVFGFPPNQAGSNFILKHFQDMGDVVEYVQPIGNNWLHLCYLSRQHADRALAKNGKLIGEFMIGVVPQPVDHTGKIDLPSNPNTITAKDPSKLYERDATLLPPKDQSWIKSIISFTFG